MARPDGPCTWRKFACCPSRSWSRNCRRRCAPSSASRNAPEPWPAERVPFFMNAPSPLFSTELAKSERRQRLVAEFGLLALGSTPLPKLLDVAVEAVSQGVDAPLVKILRPD